MKQTGWRRVFSGPGLAVLLAGLFAGSFASANPAPSFQAARPTQRIEYWQQRQIDIAAQLSRKAELPAIKLVFVGDSITDFWQLGADPWVKGQFHGRPIWDETFGAGAAPVNRALNLGISGDRTEHILFRLTPKSAGGLGELDDAALRPDYVILMAGINNTWAQEDRPVDAIVEGVKAIVLAIHARKPGARIVIQSLLPTNDEAKNRDIVQPVNARLAALSVSPPFSGFAVYLDLYPGFVDPAGKQLTALFNEGLHPSEAGYRVWRDRLAPFLDRDRASRADPGR